MAAMTNQSQARETSISPPTLQNALSDGAPATNVESPSLFAVPPTSTSGLFHPTAMQGDVQQLQQMYLSYLFGQFGPGAMRMGNSVHQIPQNNQDLG